MTKFTVLFFVLLSIVSFTAIAQVTVTSDFSTSNQSWQTDNGVSTIASAITWNAAGGNPGGHVSITAATGSASFYALAPASLNGNLSAAYNKTLTFDLQQSTAGTDNSLGDLIITNSAAGISLVYQLPSKPASGSWTSYSVLLNESLWKNGCPSCAAPTQLQMKQVLSNVTAMHIRLKYSTATASYTGRLDNFVLTLASITNGPAITSISPVSALQGTTITISGTNFNSVLAQNVVLFGGMKANIITASSTQITAQVPPAAPYGGITVINLGTGQQATSNQNFSPLYDNNGDAGGRIIPSSMGVGNSVILPMTTTGSNGFGNLDKGDLDGDGWADLVTTETSSSSIYFFRNLSASVGGSVSNASFATRTALTSLITTFGAGTALSEVTVKDFDNDGKIDIAACVSVMGGNQAGFAIYRNLSTPGVISFAAPVFFAYPYYGPGVTTSGDVDGDGRVDLVASTGSSPGNMWIVLNQSTPGNMDFAFGQAMGTNSGFADLGMTDFNNDGKPEIVASGYNSAAFTVYQNNSTPGVISMTNFNLTTTRGAAQLALADLDADNKPDLVWSGYNYPNLYMFKNIFNGTIFNASSFGPEIAVANSLANPTAIGVADMNADGKPDVVGIGSSDMAIYQNVTLAGTLNASSFMKSVVYEGAFSGESIYGAGLTIVDLDGDNKPEVSMVYTNNAISAGNKGVFIFHNESFPAPVITSLSSYTSTYGTSYTVNGNHLNTGAADALGSPTPSVRTQGELSGLSSLSNTSFTTNVVTGASSSYRMGITVHGMAAYSPLPFYASFTSSHIINLAAFPSSVDIPLSTSNLYDGLVAADFDDDGRPEIMSTDVVSGFSVTKIFKNNVISGANIGVADFTSVTNSIGASLHARADDLDADGKIDLVVNGTLARNNGTNPISFTTVFSPISSANRILTQQDFNNDGKMDPVASTGSSQVAIYENFSRKGSFSSSGVFYTISNSPVFINAGGAVTGITAADYDGDGWEDLAYGVASSGSISILRNTGITGNITLTQFAAPVTFSAAAAPNFIVSADFDGDGKQDIAVGNNTSTFVSVYLNQSTFGTMNFIRQDITTLTGTVGMDVADIDGDGKTDIVLIHQPTFSTGAFSILQNKSTAGVISFATHVDYTLTSVPVSLVIADLNTDKKPDIIILRNAGVSGTGFVTIFQNQIAGSSLVITQQPAASTDVCSGAVVTLTTAATGTTNITYQWQVFNPAAGIYSDLSNTGGYSNVATASLSINTTGSFGAGQYRCRVNGDFSPVAYTNAATVIVEATPNTPSASDVTRCGGGTVTLMASGATTGETYVWYDGSGVISGQTSNTYITPSLSTNTTYYVALTNGTCLSSKTSVSVTINNNPNCTGRPPVIDDTPLHTSVGSDLKVSLLTIVSDPDNDLDQSSIVITVQPGSGALGTINAGQLEVNYTGLTFMGTDNITIKACDLAGNCTTKQIQIVVSGALTIYNAVSPNGDNLNDFLRLENIENGITAKNHVAIFNRWGDQVFAVDDYDNYTRKFTGYSVDGKLLPAGTYFYRITFNGGALPINGFIDLRY